MNQNRVFLLHCSVSASTRQSAQIKFKDLQLPQAAVETFEKQQSIPIRSMLSAKLKEALSKVRTMQQGLYKECCIHNGDIHFLHESYFYEAVERIKAIRDEVEVLNSQLHESWAEEYMKWAGAVEEFLPPLFAGNPEGLKIAKEAYLSFFPTREEFEKPIRVFVVGPNPVSMVQSDNVEDHNLYDDIQNYSSVNTAQVLEAAKSSAVDRAMMCASKLIDDLDTRSPSKVHKKQIGDRKRGSWDVVADELKLISTYCPDFKEISNLAEKLVEVGVKLLSTQGQENLTATAEFAQVKSEIKKELEKIVASRDSTEGLENLKRSLALSNNYKDLINKIQSTTDRKNLEQIELELETELSVYKQRSKHLKKVFEKQKEVIVAESLFEDNFEMLTDSIQNSIKNSTPDF